MIAYLDPPNRTSATSRLFLEKNFLRDDLISSKSLLEFKFPTKRQNPGKWEVKFTGLGFCFFIFKFYFINGIRQIQNIKVTSHISIKSLVIIIIKH